MEIIKIGRGSECQIFLENAQASRTHALLRISAFGGMTLIDTSSNGTYINGIKIQKGRPCSVKRGDVVSFANIETLNWSLVPNTRRNIIWTIAGVAGLAALILAVTMLFKFFTSDPVIIDNSRSSPTCASAPGQTKSEVTDEDKANGNKKKKLFSTPQRSNPKAEKSTPKAPIKEKPQAPAAEPAENPKEGQHEEADNTPFII